MIGWRTVAESVIGSSHQRIGTRCQDAHACRAVSRGESDLLIAAVSDGAGSASHSHIGSELACRFWIEELEVLNNGGGIESLTKDFVGSWLDRLRAKICLAAEAEGVSARQLAATFLGVAIADDFAIFAQVGDGAIVASWAEEPDSHDTIFWPESGEYANMTFFATEEGAVEHLQFASTELRVEEVALFSDGLQGVALDMEARTAFQPFFTGMFRTLRSADAGSGDSIALGLRTFLGSKKLSERTDDDKTLILATRNCEWAERSEKA